MSYCLQAPNHPAAELHRIFLAQLHDTGARLANDGRLTDQDIHGARKSIKRARTTLRLLRPAVARSTFKETDVALRDIARPLTQVRDAKVLLDSLAALREHYGAVMECLAIDALEHALHAQRERARRDITAGADTVAKLRRALRKVELEAKQWRLDADDWKLLAPAIDRIYRQARRAFARVSEAASDERLHEWRKKAKHHWYAMQILTPLRPGHLGEIADQAHKLADYLGDDHDLSILRQYISTAEEDEGIVETLEALIDRRRSDLQDRAFAVGEQLFQQKPKKFARTLEARWHHWRDSAVPTSAPTPPPKSRTRPQAAVHLH